MADLNSNFPSHRERLESGFYGSNRIIGIQEEEPNHNIVKKLKPKPKLSSGHPSRGGKIELGPCLLGRANRAFTNFQAWSV